MCNEPGFLVEIQVTEGGNAGCATARVRRRGDRGGDASCGGFFGCNPLNQIVFGSVQMFTSPIHRRVC
jgi:hypothetical protein